GLLAISCRDGADFQGFCGAIRRGPLSAYRRPGFYTRGRTVYRGPPERSDYHQRTELLPPGYRIYRRTESPGAQALLRICVFYRGRRRRVWRELFGGWYP